MNVLNRADGLNFLTLSVKYINMKNSKNFDIFREKLEYTLNNGKNVSLCQDPEDDIILHLNAKRICCNYFR